MDRCKNCNGSGLVVGLGMMQKDCQICFGHGKIENFDKKQRVKSSKRLSDMKNKEMLEEMVLEELDKII